MDTFTLYKEIYDLLEEKSKYDIPNEPYKYKYEAREKLEAMKCLLSIGMDDMREVSADNQEKCPLVKAQFAAVLLQLGIIGLETEELSTGQEHLEKVLEIIADCETDPKCVYLAVLCYNNIAVLWAQRDDQEKAGRNLHLASDLYNKYKKKGNAEPPLSLYELFLSNVTVSSGWDAFEKLHTLSLYYLAQVMGKLGKTDEAAHLCLSTLHRQLASGEYQIISWATNAATLAKFYQDNLKFKLARRLLAAAWTMLESPVLPSVEVTENDPSSEESEEKVLEAKAEVARRWGMYCVCLLQDSSDNMYVSIQQEAQMNETSKKSEENCLEQMEFCKLELSSLEGTVDYQRAKRYEEAKTIFMSGLRWVNEARNFYTLEDHASTHALVIQDTSTLYKLLATFEFNCDRQSKMHKRRVDLLSTVLEELNPQYYLQICRQLEYELGETYSAMVDCKYERNRTLLNVSALESKINILVMKGIHHFQNFLATFNNKSNGKKPERYPEECERPVMVAYFHLGRLWSKLTNKVGPERILNTTNTLNNYKYLVDYCDKYEECAALMSNELPVCREMVQLLPLKIQALRNNP